MVFSITHDPTATASPCNRPSDSTITRAEDVPTGQQRAVRRQTADQHYRESGRRLRAQRRHVHVQRAREQPNITGFTFDARASSHPSPARPGRSADSRLGLHPGRLFDKTRNVVIVGEQQADVITTYTGKGDGTLSAERPAEHRERPVQPLDRLLNRPTRRPAGEGVACRLFAQARHG